MLEQVLAAVHRFHKVYWCPVGEKYTPGSQTDFLRHRLLEEEWLEYDDAWAGSNPEAQLDALCDMIYIILGTAVAYGWDITEAFERVHETNMKKRHNGTVQKRDDGKIIKPDGWRAPVMKDLV